MTRLAFHGTAPALLLGAALLISGCAATDGGRAPKPDLTYTLRTERGEGGRLSFVGAAGDIAGKVNPVLTVPQGALVRIELINGDTAMYNLAVPAFAASSEMITGAGATTAIQFRADQSGRFTYVCQRPAHAAVGMTGELVVGDAVD